MVHMFESHAVEFCNVIVIERIEDLTSILTAAHEAHLAQSSQLMRDRRLGHAELRGDIPNVHFPFEQNRNNSQARWVAEGAEKIS